MSMRLEADNGYRLTHQNHIPISNIEDLNVGHNITSNSFLHVEKMKLGAWGNGDDDVDSAGRMTVMLGL
ncbi:hypothetical protein L6452_09620 [Arctium lappa]|uniref:Uncharacterized protein n=1 Tax=Arctium lappa TaxID=4217 RepID=A0ACB9DL45_ARCLA|nr:hypothetical protein L6452_09620 [Arctium lappa]